MTGVLNEKNKDEANTELQDQLAYILAAAHRTVHFSLNSKLRSHGMRVETWRILETLEVNENLTMQELAEAVLLKPSTLSKLVDQMVANGLVQRQLAPEDHRSIRLLLTKLGLEMVHKTRSCTSDFNNELQKKIGGDSAKLKELLSLLT